MISLPPVVRVYLYTAPCDMRQGFDRLKALAEAGVGVDPRGGHLFVYCSRRRDRVSFCTLLQKPGNLSVLFS
jgi:transposase